MFIRLSKNIILDVTDEVTSREMSDTPRLHLYDFNDGNTTKPFYEIVQGDTAIESRVNGFTALHDNLILNPTPNFYYQDKGYISGDFHTKKRIDNVLTETITSMIQFRKLRVLFTSGYGYTPNLGELGTASTTLRVYSESDTIVNLLQYIDYHDSTNIKPIVPILYENQEFNTGIELSILDIEYLFASNTADLNELRALLFPNGKPETLFVELTQPASTEIVNITLNNKTYKKITPSEMSRNSFSLGTKVDDLVLDIKYDDRKLDFKVNHMRFDTKAFLEKNYKENDADSISVFYDLTLQYFNSSNAVIDSKYYRLSNILDVFSLMQYTPIVTDTNTDHILCSVKGVIQNKSNIRIERMGSVTITDVSDLKAQAVNVTLTSEKLYNKIDRHYTTLNNDLTIPNVVYSTKNVYLQAQAVNNIQLHPISQTIILTTTTDMTAIKNTKLKIGSYIYYSTTNNLTFKIDEQAYYTKDTKYYLMDIDNNLITSGKITR